MTTQSSQSGVPTPFSFSKEPADTTQTVKKPEAPRSAPIREVVDAKEEKNASFEDEKKKFSWWSADRRKERASRKKAAREAWRSSGVGWRVLPRTLLGIVVSLLMFGLGAGVSGAVLFAYYEARVAESENQIVEFSSNLDERIAQGVATIEESSATAQQRLDATLGPYTALLQAENGIPQVVAPTMPSVALLTTRNVDGGEVVGTATAVGAENNRTILLTDYRLVEASTADPKPEIVLTKGQDRWVADLVSWDEELGLAFLSAETTLPPAAFSTVQELGTLTGAPIFALSALNESVSPGAVIAVSEDGFRHTSVIDEDFMGGPLLNQRGEIVGFSTSSYSPSNIRTERLYWAPTIVQICDTLLVCENGSAAPR